MTPPFSTPPVEGLVLAGGRSTRMGRDKAALHIGGATLLERTVTTLQQVVPDVHVAVRTDQVDEPLRASFRILPDVLVDAGPAGGILAAHKAYPAAAWLVVACDMPLLTVLLLKQLMAERDATADATAWLSADGSGPEPLCAIYEPATLSAFRKHVAEGGNHSPRAWLQSREVCMVKQSSPAVLASANTPEEFELLADQAVAIGKVVRSNKPGEQTSDE